MTQSSMASKSSASVIEAIKSSDHDELRRLLAADPSLAQSVDERGVSALLVALYQRNENAVKAVKEHIDSFSPFEAAALGDSETLRKAIEADKSLLSVTSPDGFTLLHLAAFFARSEALTVLIDAGADLEAVAENESKVRPIHSAAASRSHRPVLKLLEAGADPNTKQHGGGTALHSAVQHQNPQMVEALLEHNADSTIQADNGQNALDMALSAGNHQLLEMLHASGSSGL